MVCVVGAGYKRLPWISLILAVISMTVVQYGGFQASNDNWPYTIENYNQYSMPMVELETVPAYILAVFPIGLWAALVLMEIFCNRSATAQQKFRFALLIGMTLFEIFIVTSTLTGIAKVVVSEPRPDFKFRCLGSDSATPTVDAKGNINCTGIAALLQDGRDSFPSGHASSSMSTGLFGTLYLIWVVYFRKIDLPWRSIKGCQNLFTYQTVHALFFVALVPFFIALGIACTRVRDHRHSPADITGGAFLGACVAAIYFFPRILLASPESECMDDQCVCNSKEWLPLLNPRASINSLTSMSACPPMDARPSLDFPGPHFHHSIDSRPSVDSTTTLNTIVSI